jgi:hypothetical protein
LNVWSILDDANVSRNPKGDIDPVFLTTPTPLSSTSDMRSMSFGLSSRVGTFVLGRWSPLSSVVFGCGLALTSAQLVQTQIAAFAPSTFEVRKSFCSHPLT